MNAPLNPQPPRTYWQPLGSLGSLTGSRPCRDEDWATAQHGVALPEGYEVWTSRHCDHPDTTMLVRIVDGQVYALDVEGWPETPIETPTWIEPSGPVFEAARVVEEMRRRAKPVPPSDWAHEQYLRELAAERRADAREEMRDYRRRSWREKSFQIE